MTTSLKLPPVRGHRFLAAYPSRGSDKTLLKTGDSAEFDASVDAAFSDIMMDDDNTQADKVPAGDLLSSLLAKAIEAGKRPKARSVSVDDAICSAIEKGTWGGDFMPTGEALKLHRRLEEACPGQCGIGFKYPLHARRERRTLTVGAGVGSVSARFPENTWMDALRSRLVLREAGCTFLSLPGDRGGTVAIPITTTAAIPTWIAEGQAPASESHDVIGDQAYFTPHTASCYTDISLQMLALGMPGFTDMIIEHLFNGIAVLVDAAGLNGTGNNNQPNGLMQGLMSNPTNPTGNSNTTIQRSDLVLLVTRNAEANADVLPSPRFAWITSASGRGTFQNLDNATTGSTLGTSGRYVWESHEHMLPDGSFVTRETILGRPAFSTTNVPANIGSAGSAMTGIVYGDMQLLACNVWPSFSLLVNPFQWSQTGFVRISIFVDVDWQLLHKGTFNACIGWTTSV